MVNTVRNVVLTGSLLLSYVGCTGKPSRVKPPTINPDKAGKMAITQYDRDGNRLLSEEELDQCPGLKRAIELYDSSGDQSVSADEIAARIRKWQDTKVGLMSVGCEVRLHGSPLEGATVKFTPESYLGEAVQPASGTTDEYGRTTIAIADVDLPDEQKGLVGTHLGVYKVEITHPDRSIPPDYNAETILGQEIAQDNPVMLEMPVVFELR